MPSLIHTARRACALALSLAPLHMASAQEVTWTRQLGTPQRDAVRAMVADGAGGVITGGTTDGDLGGPNANMGTGPPQDPWISAHDANGNQLWIQQFGSTGNEDLKALARDASGAIFSGGRTGDAFGGSHAGSSDAWFAKHDALGNVLWVRQLGTSTFDYVNCLAIDGAGGVIVSGTTRGDLAGPSHGQYDVWVARYDTNGVQLWLEQFGGAQSEFPFACCSDGVGGVFLSGTTTGSFASSNVGNNDAWIARVDGSGQMIWSRQLGTGSWDGLDAVALEPGGDVFAGGVTYGSLAGPSAGSLDAWLARFDSSGNTVWIRQLGTSLHDDVQAAAPDGDGGVLVTGVTSGALAGTQFGLNDTWVGQFDAFGNRVWHAQIGTDTSELARGVASDGTGGLFVGGRTEGPLGGSFEGIQDAWIGHFRGPDFVRVCSPAVPNSTLQPAVIHALGTSALGMNNLTLTANQLPPQAFGFFITSTVQGLSMNPGGSQGTLCLAGDIGRFVGLGQLLNSGADGVFQLSIDLMALPTPTGPTAPMLGETWTFQAWYRDANPTNTSNFTDAVAVTLE